MNLSNSSSASSVRAGRMGCALTPPSRFMLLPIALLAVLPWAAQADELDTLEFQAGQSATYDSNVFRLSDSANTQAVLGSSTRSDTVGVTTLGIKFHKSYGLQRVELDATLEDHQYSNYSQLDFTAANYAAAWRWSLTPRLHGNLTTDRREYLDRDATVLGTGQVNRRTDKTSLFDAEYEIDGVWRVLGGVSDVSSTNSVSTTAEGDVKVRRGEVGVRYVYPSGTSLAYRFKTGDGEYPGRIPSATIASSFEDTEHEVRLDWMPTGKTTVQGRVSWLDRKHDNLGARDFSGLTGQVNAVWAVTAKTSIAGGVRRELGSSQTLNESYYEGHGLFVAPTWKPTEKTAVRLRYDHGVRSYKGPLPTYTASDRRDRINIASLAVEWQALRVLKLVASMQREQRRSNTPGADYKSNSVGIAALATF